ncbi:MaoC family dehydratase [Sphaerisporangium fuscum]|uniref:MaoC family dehydratase n=1 Tax=Sphaerisporangium fuscum TaxID=2835868 RepID=UPI001BDCB8C6|nr:MaoC family dehydratase [Sphaerisporangium fuscum]
MRTLAENDIELGAALPPLRVELTPTTVISTALATRDFTPVHHDVERARAQGSKDIFLNILTTMGLVERYVTDWAGPEALVRGINVRLGVPAYAGDTLTFSGTVTSRDGGEVTVAVRGTVSLGDHATGTVRLFLPT